jgi:hypothetical protein
MPSHRYASHPRQGLPRRAVACGRNPAAAYRRSTGGDVDRRNLQKTTTTIVHDACGTFDMSHMHNTPTTDRAGPRGAFDTHHMHNTPTTDRAGARGAVVSRSLVGAPSLSVAAR